MRDFYSNNFLTIEIASSHIAYLTEFRLDIDLLVDYLKKTD